jgi:serine phosphatase RsbU (regulator of sigma subunit)
MFMPRDIVSGDFYWFTHKNGHCVITAVDCTGHGVPGAFMSIIGNDLLNDIVNIRGVVEPAQILELLDQGIRTTLKQDVNDIQDGMDMALCTIDSENKRLRYAGAKNPLIYVQGDEIFQIKADKMPIGGKQLYANSAYQNHEIALDKPTWIYMFSDGYQDQFGGPGNKKFMLKKLRELIFEIHKLPMKEQQKILQDTLKEWMGAEKQLDDILVIGLKVA